MVDLYSRAQGALVGLAAGDALGTTLEFRRRDSYMPLTDMVGGGPFKLRAGQWTDDTSMALCLTDSLLACKAHDPHDQLQRYLRWARHGENSVNGHCFDIGGTVNEALRTYIKTGEAYPGAEDEFSAGNGSLMRLAPVALFYNTRHGDALDCRQLVQMAALSSMTTHRHPAAVSACQVMALFIDHALALDGMALAPEDKQQLLQLSDAERVALGELPPEIGTIVDGSYRHKTREQINSSGYVVHSLEAALWAFWHTDNFAEGALLAANLGGDADTVAAIYGQLAGAYYGLDAIPAAWRDKLAWCDKLQQLALQLVTAYLPADEQHPYLLSRERGKDYL